MLIVLVTGPGRVTGSKAIRLVGSRVKNPDPVPSLSHVVWSTRRHSWAALLSADYRVDQLAVRFGQLGSPVWKIVVFVETDKLVNRVEHMRELCL